MKQPKTDAAFDAAARNAAADTGATLDDAAALTPPASDAPPADAPPADTGAALAPPVKRGPGRPPGSRSATTRRPGRPPRESAAPLEPAPAGLSDADAKETARFLLTYLDRAVSSLAKTSPLNETELSDGAQALAPIVKKHLGEQASPETMALVWIAGVYGPRVYNAYTQRGILPAPPFVAPEVVPTL